MGRCSVLGCKSDSERKLEDLSFHSFPEDIQVLNLWVKATGRANWTPKYSSKICSRHFLKNNIIKKKKVTQLYPGAVPTLAIKGFEIPSSQAPATTSNIRIEPSIICMNTCLKNKNGTSLPPARTSMEMVNFDASTSRLREILMSTASTSPHKQHLFTSMTRVAAIALLAILEEVSDPSHDAASQEQALNTSNILKISKSYDLDFDIFSILQAEYTGKSGKRNGIFRFPKNDALKNVWVNNMGLNGWKPKSSSVLCSRHFESHFLDPSEFCTRLRPGTIPTLFQEFSQPNEDLKNYNKHKLMNQEPILKPTATLCNIKRNALNLKGNGKQQRRVIQHNRSQKADEYTHPVEKEIKIEYIPEKDPLENVIDCKKERFSPLQDSEEENGDNKCHMFGSFVAQKLSQLSSKHRSIAQKRIGNILYELEMKEASCRTESGSETQSDIDDSGSEMSVSVKNEIESSSDFE